PLLDSYGRLIGVNTAIYSPGAGNGTGANVGIGFAVPVDSVRRIIPQLITKGRAARPELGVTTNDQLTAIANRQLNTTGVAVLGVRDKSPAGAAGLRGSVREADGRIAFGDIIQKVGDREVHTSDQLYSAIQHHNPGEAVVLTVLRDGKPVEQKVTLGTA